MTDLRNRLSRVVQRRPSWAGAVGGAIAAAGAGYYFSGGTGLTILLAVIYGSIGDLSLENYGVAPDSSLLRGGTVFILYLVINVSVEGTLEAQFRDHLSVGLLIVGIAILSYTVAVADVANKYNLDSAREADAATTGSRTDDPSSKPFVSDESSRSTGRGDAERWLGSSARSEATRRSGSAEWSGESGRSGATERSGKTGRPEPTPDRSGDVELERNGR